MKQSSPIFLSLILSLNLSLSLTTVGVQTAEAKRHSQTSSHTGTTSSRSGHGQSTAHSQGAHHKGESRLSSRHHRGATEVAEAHHGRHHGKHEHVAHAAPKTRYAYSASLFMPKPPDFEQTPFNSSISDKVEQAFEQGTADSYPARALVRAGVVHYHPLHGGIFWRREPVKYIIMHSTEPGVNQSAPRIIDSWSSMGIRHPGAQYVVDRDGAIYQAVDPELATVHINIFKTLPGINNDNSIGIEMCHTGKQDYPKPQRESVSKLVTYLQERYKVPDENIITHRYAQQGDHTDPVNFDWDGFISDKNRLRTRAIAMRINKINEEARHLPDFDPSTAASPGITTFLLQPHMEIKTTTVTPVAKDAAGKKLPASKTVTTTTFSLPPSPVTVITPADPHAVRDPMRGPIEVDPTVVRQLSYPPAPAPAPGAGSGFSSSSTAGYRSGTASGVTHPEQRKNAAPAEVEIPRSGASADSASEQMNMDPDGHGADAAPLPGNGSKPVNP
jgi:N-acetylmuramoyl-L-alanine amidase